MTRERSSFPAVWSTAFLHVHRVLSFYSLPLGPFFLQLRSQSVDSIFRVVDIRTMTSHKYCSYWDCQRGWGQFEYGRIQWGWGIDHGDKGWAGQNVQHEVHLRHRCRDTAQLTSPVNNLISYCPCRNLCFLTPATSGLSPNTIIIVATEEPSEIVRKMPALHEQDIHTLIWRIHSPKRIVRDIAIPSSYYLLENVPYTGSVWPFFGVLLPARGDQFLHIRIVNYVLRHLRTFAL